MQIKGEEFIKKVQLQQERDELEKKLSELEEVETTFSQETTTIPNSNEEQIEHDLDNIMLEINEPNNEENKKKYLILGIVLVVLFLLTIVVIRLLTNDEPQKEDTFNSKNADSTQMKKIEENANIEENFQKIINDRIKKENAQQVTNNTTTEQKLDNVQEEKQVVNETPVVVEPQKENLDETLKKIEAKIEEKQAIKEEPKVEVKKEEPKKTIQDLVKSSSNEVISGYFVQIGAFTKTPASSYINKIRDANLKYKIYKVEVKGTMYNKVLIGPYSSRAAANENIENIKKKLNLSSAYILKF